MVPNLNRQSHHIDSVTLYGYKLYKADVKVELFSSTPEIRKPHSTDIFTWLLTTDPLSVCWVAQLICPHNIIVYLIYHMLGGNPFPISSDMSLLTAGQRGLDTVMLLRLRRLRSWKNCIRRKSIG